MKNIYPSLKYKFLGRSGFWTLLLGMILLFASCVTEEPPSAVMLSGVETDQAVEDARVWFGPQEEFVVQNDFGPAAKAKTRTKKIHWDKAITHEDGRVIEVEVTYSSASVPIRSAKTITDIQRKQNIAFFRLIVEKVDDGEYVKYLMMYFPEIDDVKQKKLEVNNYSTLSSSFSGDLQVVYWDEELAEGWYIQKGEVVNRYVPKNSLGKKEKSYANAALSCAPVTEEICFSYGSDNEQMDCSTGICELPEHSVQSVCFDILAYEDPNCSNANNPGSGPGTYTGPGGGGGSGSGGGSTGGPTLLPDDEQVWQQYIDGFTDPQLKRQAQLDYLKNHGGAEFVKLINELMASGVDHYDVMEINKLVNGVYQEQRGRFFMVIFSPENFSQILFFAMSNISVSLRNKVFALSAQYSAYSEIALMLGSKSWTVAGVKITFSGYTNHGTLAYGMSKGFTPSLIKNILNSGTVTKVPYGNGYQLRILYPYNGKTIGIVVDANPGTYNFGKIVTYLTDY